MAEEPRRSQGEERNVEMELRIQFPDGLAAPSDKHEPGDQFERNQSVARRRLVNVQHQSRIKDLKLVNVERHLQEGSDADEYDEPSYLRRSQHAFGDRVAEREQQHQHRVESLGASLGELTQQVRVRRRHPPQTEIHVTIDLAQRA